MDHHHILYLLMLTGSKDQYYVGECQEGEFDKRLIARCKDWGIKPTDPQLYIYTKRVEIPKDATYRDCEQGLKNDCARYFKDYQLTNTNKIECSVRSKSLISPEEIKATSGAHKGTSIDKYLTNHAQKNLPSKIYSTSYKPKESVYPAHLCPF